LAQLGEPGLTVLSSALSQSAPTQAGYICYALGTQGPGASNAIPVLATVMETGPPQVAERAASALADIGRLAVPRLLRTLEHPDPAVRILAVNALARLGPPARAALPKLIDLAKEDQAIVRAMAIEALPKIRPTGAGVVEVLTNALRDPDQQVRAKATQALEKLQVAR
jgi:HEAT repeat protein